MKMVDVLICILSGAAVCIPLLARLLRLAADSVGQKNWSGVVRLAARLMTQAEKEIALGSDRREWVIGMTMAAAAELGCKISEEELGNVIDSLCAMAKGVNTVSEAAEK